MYRKVALAKLGQKLSELREKAKLSQHGASRLSGINRLHLRSIEKGDTPNPGIATICALLKVYRTRLSKLIQEIEK